MLGHNDVYLEHLLGHGLLPHIQMNKMYGNKFICERLAATNCQTTGQAGQAGTPSLLCLVKKKKEAVSEILLPIQYLGPVVLKTETQHNNKILVNLMTVYRSI